MTQAVKYTYVTLDDPSEPVGFSFALGINDLGQVVGFDQVGFVYSGGLNSGNPYSHLAPTYSPTAINNLGQVVGFYVSGGVEHGFLESGGVYTTLPDNPAALFDTISGINDSGQIVGNYFDGTSNHGFLYNYNGGGYTILPNYSLAANDLAVSGINDTGQIVGTYSDSSGSEHIFLYSGGANGVYTTLPDNPLATNGFNVTGINDTDQIVGIYSDGSGEHGFLYSGGVYTTLNDNLATGGTAVFGINNAGQIVGSYFDSLGQHAFIATPSGIGIDPIIVPGGRITTNDFGAHPTWGSVALNQSSIPSGDSNNFLTHPAVDITAPLGTNVDAFAGGQVVGVSSGQLDATFSSLGWYVLVHDTGSLAPSVANGQDFYTLYAHLEDKPLVSVGDSIDPGTTLGTVGTTGNETGIQSGFGLLHFEIRLFPDLFQPFTAWDLPKKNGPDANIYLYGAQDAAQLLADPLNTNLGYINPEKFLNEMTTSRVPDGYLDGATVFVDANSNGQFDPGELSVSSTNGNFVLPVEAGRLVAFGGTDISTGLSFKGILEAPAGSTAITPLTTLVSMLQNQGSSTAEAQVLAAFGIDPSTELTTFDPIAALLAGNPIGAQTYATGAEVMNTVIMIASALTGSGAIATNTVQVLTVLANLIASDGQGQIDLKSTSLLTQLVTASAQALHQSVDAAFVTPVATMVAASNSALQGSTSQLAGQALIDVISGVERLAQGASSDALQQVAADPSLVGAVANAFTGSNLTNALSPLLSGLDHAPVLATDAVPSHGVSELAGATGSTVVDAASGELFFTDADLLDPHQASAKLEGVRWVNADGTSSSDSLPAGLVPALGNSIQSMLLRDSTNGQIGEIGWNFGIQDKNIDFLGAGEKLIVTYDLSVIDNSGSSALEPVTITIAGLNDNPIAAPDINGVSKEAKLSVGVVKGVLANDTDPDIHDQGHLAVTAVDGLATNIGHLVHGNFGFLILNGDGSYNYHVADEDDLPSNIIAQDIFTYTVSDGHGGAATSSLTITVAHAGQTYIAGTPGRALTSGNGSVLLDGGLLQNQTISAGNGRDGVIAGSHDTVVLGNGNDIVKAGDGDTISLGNSNDTVAAGANSLITVGNGDDKVTAGSGSTIKLGSGDDVVKTVSSLIYAGDGHDNFVFTGSFGQSVIANFDPQHDSIQLDHSEFANFSAMQAHMSQRGANVVISDTLGDTVTLSEVNISELRAHHNDFHLV